MEQYLGNLAQLNGYAGGIQLDRMAILYAVAYRHEELRDAGVSPGDRIVIGHGRGVESIVDLFAAWMAGAAAVMVSPSVVTEERLNIVVATGARIWIGTTPPSGLPVLAPANPLASAPARPPSLLDLDAPALIMMTSGTTAKPKGVMLSHRAVLARLALNIAHIGTRDLDKTLSVLPIHFGHGLIGNCLTPLAAGRTLVAWPEPGPAGLHALGGILDEQRITFMSSVPSLWRAAIRLSQPPRLGTLRRIHVGSAPLSTELWREIAAWSGTDNVVNMYGITETANWIGGWSARDGELRDGRVGSPWGGALAVRDADGSVSPTGRGEVLVSTPALMSGYLGQPELTSAVLSGGWFRTGDIGEIDPDGNLRLVGRTRHEINRGGIKVPAEEVDMLLERHPAITEACAFPLPDALTGETVAAAVVAAQGAGPLDPREIRRWCETRIRRDAVPAKLFVLDGLPRTDRGKLNRDMVRATCLGSSDGA